MKKKNILAALSLIFSFNANADILMHGNIKSQKFENNVYVTTYYLKEACDTFPSIINTQYPSIKMLDLSYDKSVPKSYRIKELDDFLIRIEGTLKLISYDEKNKVSKFLLVLKGGSFLSYTGRDYVHSNFFETGGLQLMNGNGQIKMSDGSSAEIPIEGKIETIDGKEKWKSFHKNKYFDISLENVSSFDGACQYRVDLIRLKDDVPVIISTD